MHDLGPNFLSAVFYDFNMDDNDHFSTVMYIGFIVLGHVVEFACLFGFHSLNPKTTRSRIDHVKTTFDAIIL